MRRLGLTLGLAALLLAPGALAQQSLNLLSWGGRYGEHLDLAALGAFSRGSGIAVAVQDYPADPEPLLAAVRAGGSALDLLVLERDLAREGCREGWLRPLPVLSLPAGEEQVPALRDFRPGSLERCAVPLLVWAQMLVTRDGVEARPRRPRRLEDFFDTHGFPGLRAVRRSPALLLEWALLSEGVEPADVYPTLATPGGLRRALNRVDGVRAQLHWVDSAAEAMAMVSAGRAVLGATDSNQWYAAGAANSPLVPLWDGQILHQDVLAIPQSSPNAEAAWRLAGAMSAVEAQRLLVQLGGYGPARESALRGLSLDLQASLPGRPGSGRLLRYDGRWWRAHGARAQAAFDRLLGE